MWSCRRVGGFEALEERSLLTGLGSLVLGPTDCPFLAAPPEVTVELDDGATSLGPLTFNSFILDSGTNGILDDEAVGFQQISGVGGTLSVPELALDKLQVPTDQGVDLTWTSVHVLVLDVPTPEGQPPLDGFLGTDLLTSGWINVLLTGANRIVAQAVDYLMGRA